MNVALINSVLLMLLYADLNAVLFWMRIRMDSVSRKFHAALLCC